MLNFLKLYYFNIIICKTLEFLPYPTSRANRCGVMERLPTHLVLPQMKGMTDRKTGVQKVGWRQIERIPWVQGLQDSRTPRQAVDSLSTPTHAHMQIALSRMKLSSEGHSAPFPHRLLKGRGEEKDMKGWQKTQLKWKLCLYILWALFHPPTPRYSAWLFIVPRRPFYVSRTHLSSGSFGIHRASMCSRLPACHHATPTNTPTPTVKGRLYLTGNGAHKSVL